MLRSCALTHTGEGGLTIFGMALRFDLNEARVLVNTLLTALARSAQRTGFYVSILDALSRDGARPSRPSCCARSTISRCAPHCICQLHPKSNSVSLSFSPRQHAHCTPRTLASTHVCFERLTTEVENTTGTAPPKSGSAHVRDRARYSYRA